VGCQDPAKSSYFHPAVSFGQTADERVDCTPQRAIEWAMRTLRSRGNYQPYLLRMLFGKGRVECDSTDDGVQMESHFFPAIFFDILSSFTSRACRLLWSLFSALCWSLWHVRNRHIFQAKVLQHPADLLYKCSIFSVVEASGKDLGQGRAGLAGGKAKAGARSSSQVTTSLLTHLDDSRSLGCCYRSFQGSSVVLGVMFCVG
jgi:hypothetical protein